MREKRRNLYTHTQLRHCLAFLLFAVIPYNSFAVDACVENGTVAIILDASKNGNDNYSSDANKGTFKVSYSYGQIRGIAACLSSGYQWGENKTILIDNGVIIHGGEKNGQYCFCKLTYPVVSAWLLIDPGSWFDGVNRNCYTGCVGSCAWWLNRGDPGREDMHRKIYFESVEN